MLKSEACYLKSISFPNDFFQSTHGYCMGESSTSIPTPNENSKDASTGCSVGMGRKGGKEKEEPTLLFSEIKLQCFALLPCCGKDSTAFQPGFFFHSVAVKRSSTTATHLGMHNNWRRARNSLLLLPPK